MRLKPIFKRILSEQEFGMQDPSMGMSPPIQDPMQGGMQGGMQPQPGQEQEDTIEFPKQHFVLSIDRSKNKLTFTPEENDVRFSGKLRTLIVMLKQKFHILRVNSLEDEDDIRDNDVDDAKLQGSFEVELDTRENVDNVVNWIRQEIEKKII